MYIKLNANIEGKWLSSFNSAGKRVFQNQKETVRKKLDSFINVKGQIEVSALEEEWFPQVNADVFISHSHLDEEKAMSLAGWFYEVLGVESFIDSCVWGYANDLLKELDKRYCVRDVNNDGSYTYSYEMRNRSTAHVHMILNTALHKMIYKTECLLFLNTPNSIIVDKVMKETSTESPWIYSELMFAEMCRPRSIKDHRNIQHTFLEDTCLPLKYPVNLREFDEINDDDLFKIWQKVSKREDRKNLDELYKYLSQRNVIYG